MSGIYLCKIASLAEMNEKWDFEIAKNQKDRQNWIFWKNQQIRNYQNSTIIPYYGILDGTAICEATAMLSPDVVQNPIGLVGSRTVYLSAFRTAEEFQGMGYFSKLFWFMIEDLRKRGFVKATLGVEPAEKRNKSIYEHYGFTEYIKSGKEHYPDGTSIDVEYYRKTLE